MSSASPSSSSSSSSSFLNSAPWIQEFQETILKNLNAAHEEVRKANEGAYPEGLAEKVKTASENIFQHQLIKSVVKKYFEQSLMTSLFGFSKEKLKVIVLNSSVELVSALYEAIRIISRANANKTDSFPGDRVAVNYSVVLESSQTLAKIALNPLELTPSLTTASKTGQFKVADLLRGKAFLATHISLAEETVLREKKIKPEQVLDQEYLSDLPSYLETEESSSNQKDEKDLWVKEVGEIILKNLVQINGIVSQSKASTYPGNLASRVSTLFKKIFPYLEMGMVVQQFIEKYVEFHRELGKTSNLDKETFKQMIADNNMEFISHFSTELKSMLQEVMMKLELDKEATLCIFAEFNQTLELLAQNSLEISSPETIALKANQVSIASIFQSQTPSSSAPLSFSSSSSPISSSSNSLFSENNRNVKELLIREVGYVLDRISGKYKDGRLLEKMEKQTLGGIEFIFTHSLIKGTIEEFISKNEQEIFQRKNKEPILYPFLEILFTVTFPKIRSTDQYQKIVDDGEGTVDLIVNGELESFQEHNRSRMKQQGIRLFGTVNQSLSNVITSDFDNEIKTPYYPAQPLLSKSSSTSFPQFSPSVPPSTPPQLNKSFSASSLSSSSASPKTNANSNDNEFSNQIEKYESTIIKGIQNMLTMVKNKYAEKEHAADVVNACDQIFNYSNIKEAIRNFVQQNLDDAKLFCVEVGDTEYRYLKDGLEGRFIEGSTPFIKSLVNKVIPAAIIENKEVIAGIDFEMQSLVVSELKKWLAEAEKKLKGGSSVATGESKNNN